LRNRDREYRGQGSDLSGQARRKLQQQVGAHVSTGAPPVDYYIDAAGDALAHMHIQDNDGYADRHWIPGDGTVRWPAVFRALGRLAVTPRLLLEVRDKTQIRKAAENLEALGLVV
jgi:sugar phosphate isomerase/epimerase